MSQTRLSQELKNAAELIRGAGGVVHFPRPHVVIWDQEFTSLKAVAKDPRCEVSYLTLFKRVAEGIEPAEAVKKRWQTRACKQLVCWGETFSSIRALALDPRCEVCYNIISRHLLAGLTPEEAVKDTRMRKPITSIDQVILGAN